MPNVDMEYIREYLDALALKSEKTIRSIDERLNLIWDSYDAKTLDADQAITMLENLSERVDLIKYDLELETEDHTTQDADDAIKSCDMMLDDIESLIDLISKN